MSTRDFNSLGLAHVRYSLGFLLGLMVGGLLTVYWWSTCDTQRLVYALPTSSTLLLLLKPWFSGNFYFHFTADGAPLPSTATPEILPRCCTSRY